MGRTPTRLEKEKERARESVRRRLETINKYADKSYDPKNYDGCNSIIEDILF
ncbi:MAG: hypothetical protein MUO26_05400 [Methanotrichaceae archaeon]|nr:hypothetical protein [Methanotrichaceae archaeon]